MRAEGQTEDAQPRVLMVVNVFNPDRGGGGAIFSDLAYGLAERGMHVTVRCAYPYYPEWKDKSGQNGLAIQRYSEKGIHVERFGIFIPSKPNSLMQRLVYEASFLASLSRALLRKHDFDLVMVFCPLVGAVAYAVINRWIRQTPLWLNVQDLSADAAAASGIAKGRALISALSGVQGILFNQAQVWSSISPVMIQRLNRIRKKCQPLLYLPNWLNDSMANELAQLPNKALRPPSNPIKLLYAGNIGTKQDLLNFCEVLHSSDAPFQFRIHGNGGRADDVRAWVEKTADSRFVFGPFLDEAGFAQALNETDFFIITEKTGSGGSFIPCKTIAGLASGSAILAVCDGDSPLGQEMRSVKAGPCFSWDEVHQVPELLRAPDQLSVKLAEWMENSVKRATFYERDHVIGKFDEAIRAVVSAQGQIPSTLLLSGVEDGSQAA